MFQVLFCFVIIASVWANDYGEAISSVHINKNDDHPEIIRHGHPGYNGYHHYPGNHGHEYIDYYSFPKYDFEYKVNDRHTHDIKSQSESRHGDKVRGYYTLHQPDGQERVVHYYSDDKTGFQADVKYSTHHPHSPVHNYHHH